MTEEPPSTEASINRRAVLDFDTAAGATGLLGTLASGDAAQAASRPKPDGQGKPPAIVIIGAGAAGAVAAYRLRQLMGPSASITIIESSPRIGGRARHVNFAGSKVEVGASILHTAGRRLLDLADTLGVAVQPVGGGPGGLGVWTGDGFSFKAAPGAVDAELLAQYGPESVLGMVSVAQAVTAAWSKVYPLQDAETLFEDPGALLRAIGLEQLVSVTLADHLAAAGVKLPLLDGFVTGALRNIYNQTPDINGLAGSIALVGVGLAGGELLAVRDGNSELYAKLIAAADARLLLGTRVNRVHATARRTVVSTSPGVDFPADAVVVAAAPELARIRFDPEVKLGHRAFQEVHVTLVAGRVSPRFFATTPVPGTILTEDRPGLTFKSLGYVAESPQFRTPIWKFFSPACLDRPDIAPIFRSVHKVWRTSWEAYPVLVPQTALPPFERAPGIFTVSSMESAVSTMEHEAVAAWNVAGLVHRRLTES